MRSSSQIKPANAGLLRNKQYIRTNVHHASRSAVLLGHQPSSQPFPALVAARVRPQSRVQSSLNDGSNGKRNKRSNGGSQDDLNGPNTSVKEVLPALLNAAAIGLFPNVFLLCFNGALAYYSARNMLDGTILAGTASAILILIFCFNFFAIWCEANIAIVKNNVYCKRNEISQKIFLDEVSLQLPPPTPTPISNLKTLGSLSKRDGAVLIAITGIVIALSGPYCFVDGANNYNFLVLAVVTFRWTETAFKFQRELNSIFDSREAFFLSSDASTILANGGTIDSSGLNVSKDVPDSILDQMSPVAKGLLAGILVIAIFSIEEFMYTGQLANLPTDICIGVGVLFCQEVGFGYLLWWTTRKLIVDLDYGTI